MIAKGIRPIVYAAVSALLAPVLASAQSDTVFVTSRDNEVRTLDFEGGTSSLFASIPGNAFTGLVVVSAVENGQTIERVVVGSTTQGGAVLLMLSPNGTSGSITNQPFPGGIGGIAADAIGNIYAVNDGGSASQLWVVPRKASCPTALTGSFPPGCHPGGYGNPELIDSSVAGAQILADVAVIPYPVGADFEAGHLAVVVQRPSKILRYPAACLTAPFPCRDDDTGIVTVTTDFDAEPTSIALAPDGALLVTAGARVQRFTPEGDRTDDFVGTLPGNGAGIAVGPQGGQTRAFVSTRNSGAAHRYDLSADGTTGVLNASVGDDLQSPRELGSAASSAAVATPASETGTTILANADQISFQIVDQSGQTFLQAFVFPDCRELATPCTLSNPLSIQQIAQGALPSDFIDFDLPPTFRGLPDESGVPTFVVLNGDTGALFRGPVEHHILEEQLGLEEGQCAVAAGPPVDWTREPRTCYFHSGSTSFVEGDDACIDISTGCGSNVGRGWGFSSFVTGRDLEDVAVSLGNKLDGLKRAVTCVSRKDRRDLDKLLRGATRSARQGDYCGVEDALTAFRGLLDTAVQSPQANACQSELDARGESALFMNEKLLPAEGCDL